MESVFLRTVLCKCYLQHRYTTGRHGLSVYLLNEGFPFKTSAAAGNSCSWRHSFSLSPRRTAHLAAALAGPSSACSISFRNSLWYAGPLAVQDRGVPRGDEHGNVPPRAGQQAFAKIQVPGPSLEADGVGRQHRVAEDLAEAKLSLQAVSSPEDNLEVI